MSCPSVFMEPQKAMSCYLKKSLIDMKPTLKKIIVDSVNDIIKENSQQLIHSLIETNKDTIKEELQPIVSGLSFQSNIEDITRSEQTHQAISSLLNNIVENDSQQLISSVIDTNKDTIIKALQPIVSGLSFQSNIEDITQSKQTHKAISSLINNVVENDSPQLIHNLIETNKDAIVKELQPIISSLSFQSNINEITQSKQTQKDLSKLLNSLLVDGPFADDIGDTFQDVFKSVLTSKKTRDAIQDSANKLNLGNIIKP